MSKCSCEIDSHLPKSMSRRDILKFGTAAAGLVALGPLTSRLIPTATGSPLNMKRMVVINLFGGNDTLNMMPPTYLNPYFERRVGLAIQPGAGLSLNQGPAPTDKYILHPSLPTLRTLWAEGSAAAIKRVGYPRANLSHFSSQDIYSTGVRDGFPALNLPTSGWIARYADNYARTPLGAVSVGVGRPLDFIGGSTNPFLVNSLEGFDLLKAGRGFREETPEYVHRSEAAKNVLDTWSGVGNAQEARVALSQAYDLADQVQAAVANFQSNSVYDTRQRIGRQLKDIATLIQSGFETQIFFTGDGGYDTHGDQGQGLGRHQVLFDRLDGALGAFVQDLKDMGVWNDTVIVIMTEFGRRNFVNGSLGTDHGGAYTEWIVGGNVQPGVYGPDLTEADLNENWMDYAVDFRDVYMQIMSNHMGVDPDPVFPEQLEMSTNLGFI